MKILAKLIVVISFPLIVSASTPDDYFGDLSNLSGYKLKTAIKEVLKSSHKDRGYGALMNVYFSTDADKTYDNDGSIVDIYSEEPSSYDPYNFKNSSSKCGTYKKESDCFNREHLMPQSVFDKSNPMRSDVFHVFPTDGYVNGRRSNYPFGEVKNPKWQSKNGSKLGTNTTGNYNGTVFEPIDEFKGDIARALLYFATRYEDRVSSWHHDMLNGTRDQVYQTWFLEILLKWHKQDPVSQHEINRNNIGQKYQGNRNPFIDHPEWVEKIWSQYKK